jgi:hypothetical protein
MPNRTAKFVSAVFASVLAGASLTTISHGETVAADNCLSGPKGETPPGSHWYYRIEHSTKRHCWHLRGEGDGLSQAGPQTQAAPQNILPPAKPPAPQANPATQRSVDNARAELPAQTNRNEEPNTAWPAIAQGVTDISRANAADANAGSAVVASRWPEPSGMSPASSPRPAPSSLADNEPANPIVRSAPPAAVVTHATADSSSQNQPGPIPRWFVAVVGPVAFGSLAVSLFFKFGRSRHQRRSGVRARRRPVWEQTDDDRIVLSDYPDADVIPRRPQFARGFDEASRTDHRMAEFHARMSRRAPT